MVGPVRCGGPQTRRRKGLGVLSGRDGNRERGAEFDCDGLSRIQEPVR